MLSSPGSAAWGTASSAHTLQAWRLQSWQACRLSLKRIRLRAYAIMCDAALFCIGLLTIHQKAEPT